MLGDTALKNLQACLASIDELTEGKFIFAENIISKILSNISKSDEIYDLISECMKNFNFEKELNKSKVKMPTKDGYFVMPDSRALIIPLVFCILVDIRDKKINFSEFLEEYFKSNEISEYENFANTVILPFKQAILYCFDMENQSGQVKIDDIEKEEEKKQEKIKKEQEQEHKKSEIMEELKEKNEEDKKLYDFFKNIKTICDQLLFELSQDRRIKEDIKDDCLYIIGCLKDNADKQDLNNISALIVSSEYMFKKVKSLRFVSKDLREELIKLYD